MNKAFRVMLWEILAIAIIGGVLMFCACKPPAPPPAPAAVPTVAIVGGLGSSRMQPVADAIRTAFPAFNVVDFGDNDAYLASIAPWLLANAKGDIILAGHSKGAGACASAATILIASGRTVRLLLMFDAVAVSGSTITVPVGVPCIHFKAGIPTPFIVRATIRGACAERVYAWTFHNSIPRLAAADAAAAIKAMR